MTNSYATINPISTNVHTITQFLAQCLRVDQFQDYCPNGLQVQGKHDIHSLMTGVTLNQALIDAAIAQNVDGILVHHGLFWKGDDPCVTALKYQRLHALLQHGINLWAYHLPLDAHPEHGNNAQLGQLWGLSVDAYFGAQNLGCLSHTSIPAAQLMQGLARLGEAPTPLMIGELPSICKKVAWCSGGAQSYFEASILAGADVFITGEISEQYVHIARESGVCYVAAGHHATERFGVQAIGKLLHQTYGIACLFVDIFSPV